MEHKVSLLKSMKLRKGDTFKFGAWEGHPIDWQVLATREGIFCISRYCLTTKRFDKSSSDWGTSELRQWLNSDFYDKAFNSEEKSFILSYEDDKIKLLSIDEVEKYLPTDSERIATDRDGDWAWWWLRSQYFSGYDAALVISDGRIYGIYVDYASSFVRPVIYLSKNVEEFLESEEV